MIRIFFAGVVFAIRFRGSQRPEVDLGWNVAGVILGGLSENASLMLGFERLLLVAVLFYALSALPRRAAVASVLSREPSPAS